MDASTITFLVGIISCIIGVLTFITGRLSKAERDGRFAEKLDTCAKGIDEIKTKLGVQEIAQNQQNVILGEHEQRLKSLESRVKTIEEVNHEQR